jgi:hypothetical protein
MAHRLELSLLAMVSFVLVQTQLQKVFGHVDMLLVVLQHYGIIVVFIDLMVVNKGIHHLIEVVYTLLVYSFLRNGLRLPMSSFLSWYSHSGIQMVFFPRLHLLLGNQLRWLLVSFSSHAFSVSASIEVYWIRLSGSSGPLSNR